ncbi:MAG: membrane protein insertase YidC [Treponema sp.]|nr:membrane protein insertase YidC [Treponema sp.]
MFLYYIIIHPIKQILETCYILFNFIFHNAGYSIIGLSFVVTLFCLPLYIVAEQWQEKERTLQKLLAPGTARIKKAFHGDEQYMMLTAFYKEHKYHPIMALRSSFGLLIQIPFFMAAYSYLSHLTTLQGASFWFIRDLGAPDATFTIGSFAVNMLPIAMTVINCVAGAIYAKGHGLREQIQIYACALVFLVLLYTSPAGLVLYWTMNNVLSLVKNIFYKLKHPLQVLYVLTSLCALYMLYYFFIKHSDSRIELKAIIFLFAVCILATPLLIKGYQWLTTHLLTDVSSKPSQMALLFVLGSLTLALTAGLAIPSTIIESEPKNFCYIDGYNSPFVFLRIVLYQAIGLFVFWTGCMYALFSKKTKQGFTLIVVFAALYGLVNNFFFGGNYGPLTPELYFMEPQFFEGPHHLIILNAVIALALFAVTLILLTKKSTVLTPVFAIFIFALLGISIKNIAIINNEYRNMEAPVIKDNVEPIFHLSKTGKNVLVFMQDRNFSPIVDDICEENQQLAKQFDGFIFYENATSFGQYTMIGVPGLFGGYDYTPYEINKRTDKTLREKYNESILSMPVLFSEHGYTSTVADIPYENFLKTPLTEMYDGYPQINRLVTRDSYIDYWCAHNNFTKVPYHSTMIIHNFIMFGVFKLFPPVLRKLVYAKDWWDSGDPNEATDTFIRNYAELDLLPQLCDTTSDTDTFMIIDNESTHEPVFLQAPDYIPVNTVTDYGNSKYPHSDHYHAQAATFRLYGKFFDYLREQGVYDNTRIIIVSDHGTGFDIDFIKQRDQVPFRAEEVLACLLVKDFNSHTYNDGDILLKKDDTFMTNADVPALATEGIIPDARNPFTNNPLKVADKAAYIKISYAPGESTRNRDHTQFTIKDTDWYTVHDDVRIGTNWSRYTE